MVETAGPRLNQTAASTSASNTSMQDPTSTGSVTNSVVGVNAAQGSAPGTSGTATGAQTQPSTPKTTSTKAELEFVQIYCPRKDEWITRNIGRKLARLACALYKDYVYIVSNNVSSSLLFVSLRV